MLSRFDSGIQIAFTTFPNHILIIINQEKLLSLNLISKYFLKVWKKKFSDTLRFVYVFFKH